MKKITNKVLFLIGAAIALQPVQSQAFVSAKNAINGAKLATVVVGAGLAGYYGSSLTESFLKNKKMITADLSKTQEDSSKNIIKADIDREGFREGIVNKFVLPTINTVATFFDVMNPFGVFALNNTYNTKRAWDSFKKHKEVTFDIKTGAYVIAGIAQAFAGDLIKKGIGSLKNNENKWIGLGAAVVGQLAFLSARKELNTMLQMYFYRNADDYNKNKKEIERNQALKDLVATGLSLSKLGYDSYNNN